MLRPTLDEVREVAKRGEGNVLPVYREVRADLETPVSAFLKVRRGEYSFLLESVEGGERLARFSFIGTQPYRVLTTGDNLDDGEVPGDPLVHVEDELRRFRPVKVDGLPRFTGGAVGYMAYEVARYYERLPMPVEDPQGFPESVFLFTDTLLVFDHLQHIIKVVSHVRLDGDIEASYRQAAFRIEELVERLEQPLLRLPYEVKLPRTNSSGFVSNNTREDFMEKVLRAKEYIKRGDTYQIQVSQRFTRHTEAHPFEVYRSLRRVNPSPYMYYLELDDLHVVGASPEMLVRIEDGAIETHPIAGTRRRGRDEADETRMAEELQTSEKERAEHIMLVDLARNDLGRVCQPGSVEVTSLMAIERYSHVMHMVSHVVGKLQPQVSSYDAVRAYFPHGTVTGAPKIRTMEIIAELEGEQRGGYGGCVGYFDLGGNCDTALAIRTIWMKDGVAYVQAAGGVVYDSTPEEEYLESGNKARAMMRAIDEAEINAAEMRVGSLGYG
ncbi:MAG TPA: anthranilate synthase component I [Tepidiformaceae bacterium]|nr:anthranilate synthase component I [Tepidiformaceae bacterium]